MPIAITLFQVVITRFQFTVSGGDYTVPGGDYTVPGGDYTVPGGITLFQAIVPGGLTYETFGTPDNLEHTRKSLLMKILMRFFISVKIILKWELEQIFH